jgi:hypothetical protein
MIQADEFDSASVKFVANLDPYWPLTSDLRLGKKTFE